MESRDENQRRNFEIFAAERAFSLCRQGVLDFAAGILPGGAHNNMTYLEKGM